jgi:hypothetical protein
MGDSFYTTTMTGQPFTWGANDSATFAFHVDGSVDIINMANSSFLGLLILSPGGLDVFAARQNGTSSVPIAPYILSSFRWELTDLLNYPIDIEATFFPGGDFEWSMTLTSTVNNFSNAAGSAYADFFNTVHASYAGPDDTLTLSASGAFPGTEPLNVPEPATLALLGTGLLGVVAMRRRRKTKT